MVSAVLVSEQEETRQTETEKSNHMFKSSLQVLLHCVFHAARFHLMVYEIHDWLAPSECIKRDTFKCILF